MYYVSTSFFYSYDQSDLKTKLFANKSKQEEYIERIKNAQTSYINEILSERFNSEFDGKDIKTEEFEVIVTESEDHFCITFKEKEDNTIEEMFMAFGEKEII